MPNLFKQRLEAALDEKRQSNLFRRIQTNNSPILNLSANDYFGLCQHPRVKAGAERAMTLYGTGSGASPLLSGYYPCHEELLSLLRVWIGKPAGLLFNSGFTANQALMLHLPGPNDLVLVDRLIHHSIAQALKRAGIRFRRYHHLDMQHLESMLASDFEKFDSVFVVTESVFSMDGDIPDLKKLVSLKATYPFTLILDEAHATGVYGESGAGVAEEMGIVENVDILVGTLGKSLASMGAYIMCSDQLVVDYIINFAGEFIYSTFFSPAQAGAAVEAIKIIQQSQDSRQYLRELSSWFRNELEREGWEQMEGDSPVIPILLGDEDTTLQVYQELLGKEIRVGAVRPPTVPKGTSRLRVSLHTGITKDHLKTFIETIRPWKKP